MTPSSVLFRAVMSSSPGTHTRRGCRDSLNRMENLLSDGSGLTVSWKVTCFFEEHFALSLSMRSEAESLSLSLLRKSVGSRFRIDRTGAEETRGVTLSLYLSLSLSVFHFVIAFKFNDFELAIYFDNL
eukprot:TRINITY_DN8258_c0_g1_i1.p1 TRINITY_DN8258_c0_g1~~TRINITY_DN8258_c0_g1_i1.p1  ORF type:complete len:128 (-),score=12.76 TRINITY_DN8258_c0_g1_i1:44-427(-)